MIQRLSSTMPAPLRMMFLPQISEALFGSLPRPCLSIVQVFTARNLQFAANYKISGPADRPGHTTLGGKGARSRHGSLENYRQIFPPLDQAPPSFRRPSSIVSIAADEPQFMAECSAPLMRLAAAQPDCKHFLDRCLPHVRKTNGRP
jgi:hypothetical protein